MAPPKKMSLQEFFSDESYGGSWADDEIDISSISVPIEKNRGYGYGANANKYGSGFGAGRSAYLDNGPPYIVKLSNIPVTSNDAFINDLFHSRFTPLVKFKILFDPSSSPLDSGLIKKIAFVELPSFETQSKVAKWQDVEYRGSRRVVIEVADFNDFQQSMRFNQENQSELLRAEQQFFASGPRHAMDHSAHSGNFGPGGGRPTGRAPGGMPLDDIHIPGSRNRMGPPMRSRHFPSGDLQHPEPASHVTAPPRPKPNPFGSAKPVDVAARQQEIEKNLHNLKQTSGRSSWVEDNTRKAPSSRDAAAGGARSNDNTNSTPKMSLADILNNSKAKDHTKNPRAASANTTPKPVARKPTVLMKKSSVSTPEPQVKSEIPSASVSQPEPEKTAQKEAPSGKEKSFGQHESVESIEKQLASTPVESQKQPTIQVSINPPLSGASDRKKPSESRNGKEVQSVQASNPEKADRKENNTKVRSTEASSEKAQKPERKIRERRRSSERNSGIRQAKSDTDGASHGSGERRQRRPSNRNRERPARPENQAVESTEAKQNSGSAAKQAAEENISGDGQKPRRDSRPRRQGRRQSTGRVQENAGQKNDTQVQEKPDTSTHSPSVASQSAPGTSSTGLPMENDTSKSEDRSNAGRGRRSRGRGYGRGGARTEKSDGAANEESRRRRSGGARRGRGRDATDREGGPVREKRHKDVNSNFYGICLIR